MKIYLKGLGIRISTIISAVLLSLLLSAGISSGADDEFQLLKVGYEHFFSYRPEKAAETFKTFLKNFPESSARDAAMFWLGKSFVQLKSFDEAERLFFEIKRNFPESPFRQFIDSELEEVGKMKSAAKGKEDKITTEVAKDKDIKEPADEKKLQETGKRMAEAIDGRNKMKALLDDEMKKSEEMKAKVSVLAARESELKGRIDGLEKQMKQWPESEKNLTDLKTEKDRLLLENKRLTAETVQIGRERDELKDKMKIIENSSEYTSLLSKIEEEQKNLREAKENNRKLKNEKDNLELEIITYKDSLNNAAAEKNALAYKMEEMEKSAYQREKDMNILNSYLTYLMFQKKPDQTEQENKKVMEERDAVKALLDAEKKKTDKAPQIISYMTNAAVVLNKLGIREVLWRTGDVYNDFVAEQILFDEANKAGTVLQQEKYKELVERYKLNKEESDYLRRYMTIGSLVVMKAGDVKEDMIIEVLLVEYESKNIERKKTLATELQKHASSGRAFEDVQRMYPDLVKFYRLDIPEFSSKFRAESKVIQKIKPNEDKPISVWTERGYMIMKPLSRKQSYSIFEDLPQYKKEEIKVFLRKWLEELKI